LGLGLESLMLASTRARSARSSCVATAASSPRPSLLIAASALTWLGLGIGPRLWAKVSIRGRVRIRVRVSAHPEAVQLVAHLELSDGEGRAATRRTLCRRRAARAAARAADGAAARRALLGQPEDRIDRAQQRAYTRVRLRSG